MTAKEWQEKKEAWLKVTGLDCFFIMGIRGGYDLRGRHFTFFGQLSQNRDGRDVGRQFVVDMVVAGLGYCSSSEMHVGTAEAFYLLAMVAAFGPESAKFMYDDVRHQWEVHVAGNMYVGEIVFS